MFLEINVGCYRHFLAKARPEALLRYLSKSTARSRSMNATAVLIRQGLFFAVCGFSQNYDQQAVFVDFL